MRFTFIIIAGDNEIFSKDSFNDNVGRPIIVNGRPGVVNKVAVDDNGKSVEFTVDCQGDPIN